MDAPAESSTTGPAYFFNGILAAWGTRPGGSLWNNRQYRVTNGNRIIQRLSRMRTTPSALTHRRLPLVAFTVATGIGIYLLGYWQGSRTDNAPAPNDPSPVVALVPETKAPPVHPDPEPLESKPAPETSPRQIQSKRSAAPSTDWRSTGLAEARSDWEKALDRAQSLNGREQALYVSGLFQHIAENSSPRDALTIASAQEGAVRSFALKALVAEWAIDKNLPTDQRENRQRRVLGVSNDRFGLEVELASILSRAETDPSVKSAWIDAFPNHPSRSEIAARLSPSLPDFDPRQALTRAEGWTEWEKSRFAASLVDSWSRQNPREAWEWFSQNPGSLPAEASSQIVNAWAQKNPNELIQSLNTITDPSVRQSAIEAISASLASRGTDQALDWVESLPPGYERDLGMQAVYENTPKGIGAVMKVENGYPQIAEIMPTGALASTDLQPGDLIVQSRDSGSEPQDLYGKDLGDIVGLLRGPPGSEVEIRVLRKNETTGQLEEHSATVVRDLLILDSSSRN